MSADLFAEFNDLSQNSAPAHEPGRPKQPPPVHPPVQPPAQPPGWAQQDLLGLDQTSSLSHLTSPPSEPWHASQAAASTTNRPPAASDEVAADDDEGWGDFEVAEATPASTVSPMPPSLSTRAQDLLTSRPIGSQAHAGSKTAINEPNVLFDADDFELQDGEVTDDDGDEFGDFEIAAEPPPPTRVVGAAPVSTPAPSFDLLSLDEPPQVSPQEVSQQLAPDKRSGPLSFGASAPSRTTGSGPSSSQQWASYSAPMPLLLEENTSKVGGKSDRAGPRAATRTPRNDDGDWAAWDDFPGPDDSLDSPMLDDARPPDNWTWGVGDDSKPPDTESTDAGPPTNVPPPSVILSTFPELFGSGNLLFKPIASQNASVKQKVLSDPKAAQYLQGYILLGSTAARVIAGRKHRWHRDKILAKSMSLSAAGSKGMKLAGVDKTQAAREDRETADVVAAWREHVGPLRSAVAAANTACGANMKVPELSDKMQAQAAKMVPTARAACLLCGLKREERIAKVDFDVEDSFGEWWVEHWGHRACKNFWLEHEQRLRQR